MNTKEVHVKASQRKHRVVAATISFFIFKYSLKSIEGSKSFYLALVLRILALIERPCARCSEVLALTDDGRRSS